MKLIISTTSPYSRKCRVMVRELGLENEVEEVEAQPFEDDPELIRANPLGRVPCLQLDDGQALTESALIADYLAERPETPGRGTGMTGASRRWATGCSTLPSCGAWKWSGTRGSGRTTGSDAANAASNGRWRSWRREWRRSKIRWPRGR